MGLDSGYTFVDARGIKVAEGGDCYTRNNHTIPYESIFSMDELIVEISNLGQSLVNHVTISALVGDSSSDDEDTHREPMPKMPSTWTCEEMADAVEKRFPTTEWADKFLHHEIKGKHLKRLDENTVRIMFEGEDYYEILAWLYLLRQYESETWHPRIEVEDVAEAIGFYAKILQTMHGYGYSHVKVHNR